MDELTIEQARCLLYDETSEAIEAVPEEAVEAPGPAVEPNGKDAVGLGVDIVEIDAGDTYAYDEEALKTQKAREEAAKERIFSLLPDDQKEALTALFDEFEENRTPEARYAHAMDNLQPLILNHSNGGSDWVEHGVTASTVYGRQKKTKLGSEKLYEVTDQIIRENIRKGVLPEGNLRKERD